MKNILKALVLVAFTGVATNSHAQQTSTASASITATIVTPISISKTVDMAFGSLSVGSGGGTVILSTAGARSTSGDVSVITSSSASAASFTVTGAGTNTFAITLPSSPVTLDDVGNSNHMTVTGFNSTPSGTGALVGGTKTVTVGATLNVGGSQVTGSYTAAIPFDVVVNYN